jgi:predicted secreted protein
MNVKNHLLRRGVVSTPDNPPSWNTTPCLLSVTAYSIYWQLAILYIVSHSSNSNKRTRQAVVTGTHISWAIFLYWFKIAKVPIFTEASIPRGLEMKH